MNARADTILLEAMALAPEERSLIALSLLDSVRGEEERDDALVASWVAEARARHEELVAGRVQGLTAQEFRSWFQSL